MSELETETVAQTADLGLVEPGSDEGGELEVRSTDADLLAIPPRADDLGTALAARPQRIKLPKVTTALVAAALVCAGFLGGALVEKNSTKGTSAASAFGGAAGGRAGRAGFGGAGAGAGAGTGTGTGSNAISGTVTVVNGNTLYITATNGSVYTVTTNGSTAISIAQSGALSQLKPGQTVVVSGSGDNNGNVTATSITAGATGATPTNTTSTGQ